MMPVGVYHSWVKWFTCLQHNMLSYMNLYLTSVWTSYMAATSYTCNLNIALWHKCAEQLWVDLLLVC